MLESVTTPAALMTQAPTVVSTAKSWMILKYGRGVGTICYAAAYPIQEKHLKQKGRRVLIVALRHGLAPEVVIDGIRRTEKTLNVQIGPKHAKFRVYKSRAFAEDGSQAIKELKKFVRVYVRVRGGNRSPEVIEFNLMGFSRAYRLSHEVCEIAWTGRPLHHITSGS